MPCRDVKLARLEATRNLKEIVYRINHRDELVYVNEGWDRFAEANEGHDVVSGKVLTRSLWDFVSDTSTRAIYRRLIDLVREGRSTTFTLRCDSPTRIRILEMTIALCGECEVEFRTRELEERPRDLPVQFSYSVLDGEEFLRVCGWCKKVDVEGSWVELDEAVDSQPLLHCFPLPRMTHGICEPCFLRMTEELPFPEFQPDS